MSEQKDLDFLLSISQPFFKQIHIKKTLVAIREENITGWEKWLQIEFATFLRNHRLVKTGVERLHTSSINALRKARVFARLILSFIRSTSIQT